MKKWVPTAKKKKAEMEGTVHRLHKYARILGKREFPFINPTFSVSQEYLIATPYAGIDNSIYVGKSYCQKYLLPGCIFL